MKREEALKIIAEYEEWGHFSASKEEAFTIAFFALEYVTKLHKIRQDYYENCSIDTSEYKKLLADLNKEYKI